MLKRKSLAIVLIAICQLTIIAQEKKFSLSGSIDAYHKTNINAPYETAPGSSFANLPGFALGMANVIVSYEGKKAGFVADLVFGPRGTDAIFASPMYSDTGNIVNQLYAYLNISESVKLTLGNFNTFLGYEVISPIGNFNYSTSYLFSYGPFSHTGLKADFTLSDDWSLMLAVMNPTDATELNPNGKYAMGAQIGYSDQFLNFLYDNGGFEIDYTGGFDITKNFFLGINAAYFNNDDLNIGFGGLALYPQYSINEDFILGLRAEYFKQDTSVDFDPIGTGISESSVFVATLSGNYIVGDLTIIPELRLDSSSDDFFLDNDATPQSSLASFLVAAVYKF
ncbi:porin [Tenacibaculum adriaticum]|nr:porin [Tenacibaculum adriaticum]